MCKLVICGHGLSMIKQLACEIFKVAGCDCLWHCYCNCLWLLILCLLVFQPFPEFLFVLEFFVHYFTPMMQYHLRSCT